MHLEDPLELMGGNSKNAFRLVFRPPRGGGGSPRSPESFVRKMKYVEKSCMFSKFGLPQIGPNDYLDDNPMDFLKVCRSMLAFRGSSIA